MSFPNTIQGDYAASYETDAVAAFPLGQRMECPNGRIFRYAEMGTTVGVAAKLYSAEATNTEWDTMSTTTTITALTSTSVSYTNGASAVAQDELKYGYVIYEGAANLGEARRIFANHPAASGGTGKLYLFPNTTFETALAIAEVITVIKSPWKDIIITPPTAAAESMPLGVPQVAIAANEHGWVQTHGVASCRVEGTIVAGVMLRPTELTTSTLGGCLTLQNYDEGAASDRGDVARAFEVIPTGDFGAVFLIMEGLS